MIIKQNQNIHNENFPRPDRWCNALWNIYKYQNRVAPLVWKGGSCHTRLAAPTHKNIHFTIKGWHRHHSCSTDYPVNLPLSKLEEIVICQLLPSIYSHVLLATNCNKVFLLHCYMNICISKIYAVHIITQHI